MEREGIDRTSKDIGRDSVKNGNSGKESNRIVLYKERNSFFLTLKVFFTLRTVCRFVFAHVFKVSSQ